MYLQGFHLLYRYFDTFHRLEPVRCEKVQSRLSSWPVFNSKHLPPLLGFDPRTVQPVVNRYNNWATRPRHREGCCVYLFLFYITFSFSYCALSDVARIIGWTIQAMDVSHNTEACSCNQRCSGKAVGITYSVCVCSLRYPARNEHAPYGHLWHAPVHIFPYYLLKVRFSGGKKVIEHKTCSGFLCNFCLKQFSFYKELIEILS
jgi:hypothetical protein